MAFKLKPADAISRSKLCSGFRAQSLASYDPRTQCIVLSKYEKKDYQDLEKASSSEKREFNSLVIHEFAHWLDHVSTLWGQQNLIDWYRGLEAYRAQDEKLFSSILRARYSLETAKYATYFNTVEIKDHGLARADIPWVYQFRVGQAFDHQGNLDPDHPLLFTRFWTSKGESVGRVPMSIGSLLEVNAMASEIFFDLQEIEEATDFVEKAICKERINEKYQDFLYSAELTEYSVAAHSLGNSVKEFGIFDAYLRAARLSEVALNLPTKRFGQVAIPKGFEGFGELHAKFLKRCDRGYAFWCLCRHADASVGDIEKWTDKVLSNAGLPPRAEIANETFQEMEKMSANIPSGELGQRLEEILRYGRSIIQKHGLQRTRDIYAIYENAKKENHLPITLLGDDTLMEGSAGWEIIKPENVESWCDENWDFDSWSEDFARACFPKA